MLFEKQKMVAVCPANLRRFIDIVFHWKKVHWKIVNSNLGGSIDRRWMQKVIGRAEMIQKRYPDDKDIQQFVMILGGGDIG